MQVPRHRFGAMLALGAICLIGVLLGGCGGAPKASSSDPLLPPDRRTRLLGVPDEYKGMKNPLPATAANQQAGQNRYNSFCSLCHGEQGRGDVALGRTLYPRAADLTAPATQKLSDGELFWIIAQGIRYSGMPAGHDVHTEEQMWQMP